MPTYAYECEQGHEFDRYLPLHQWNKPQVCDCGKAATKVLTATYGYVQGDVCYDSPIDGKAITSRRQRKEDMARNGCMEYDPEMKKDAARRRRQADESLDRSVDATVEESFEKMDGKKRERLANELAAGAVADVVRK